jgi:hypothetical protein
MSDIDNIQFILIAVVGLACMLNAISLLILSLTKRG